MPTGVMDIRHLLCHPCDPMVTSTPSMSDFKGEKQELSSILLQKSCRDQIKVEPPSYRSEVEFWEHSRSNSTRSSCSSTTSSSSSSGSVASNSDSFFSIENYHYSYYVSPAKEKRQRVNSDLCRSHSTLISVNEDPIIAKKCPPIIATTGRQRSRTTYSSNYTQTRTPWTPEEDDLLQKGYEQGLSWAMISSTYLPSRSRGCCWGRFKTLQSKNVIEVYQKRICQRPWKIANLRDKYNNQH